jgi:hypothetical protein
VAQQDWFQPNWFDPDWGNPDWWATGTPDATATFDVVQDDDSVRSPWFAANWFGPQWFSRSWDSRSGWEMVFTGPQNFTVQFSVPQLTVFPLFVMSTRVGYNATMPVNLLQPNQTSVLRVTFNIVNNRSSQWSSTQVNTGALRATFAPNINDRNAVAPMRQLDQTSGFSATHSFSGGGGKTRRAGRRPYVSGVTDPGSYSG